MAVQILTLLGVVMGAMASFISTRLLNRSQDEREDKLRWDAKQLDAYSEFATTVKNYIQISRRLCAELGLPSSTQPLERASGLVLLATAAQDMEVKWGMS